MIKKYLSFILFLFLLPFGGNFVFAQEAKKDAAPANDTCVNCPKAKQIVFPPIPLMKNTGNAEKDKADYAAEKDKWIEDVLTLYKNRLSPEQANKLREVLRKENLEDVMKGKVLFNENELQGK